MDKRKEALGIVGFCVEFSKNLVTVTEPGAILIFDRVISNVKRCYDTSTGIFTAPCNGQFALYISGVAITNDENGYVDLTIERKKNNSRPFGPIARVYLKAYFGDFMLGCQGCGSARVKLERGEQIIVRHTRGDHVLKGGRHTRFSGVLEHVYDDPQP
ncbi:uncharacterized protein [Littorina saxatilis]|uniref:C1q domain-containing protein n=1 Tax=Littorina saxatilis TaxID=31220 RepID=A0AAN9B5Y3_9CAEN